VTKLKDEGNAHMKSDDFDEAIACYTKALNIDKSNHVLYSNRSAAYAKRGKYEEALGDAEKTVQLKPDWARGYSRLGSALCFLGMHKEAKEAYEKGLKIEPNNQQMLDALESVKQNSNNVKPKTTTAFPPDSLAKLLTNPKTREYLNYPSYMALINDLQENPTNISEHLNDPRTLPTLSVLLGLNFGEDFGGGGDDTMDVDPVPQQEPRQPPRSKPAAEKEPAKSQPAEDHSNLSPQQKQAKQEKEKGNEAYKKKDFENALLHYSKAVEHDPTEITYYNNIAAVYFEQKEYRKVIEQCEKAIEIGRENRADFKLIAKAFSRIGNAYKKLEDWRNAKIYFEKSMSEHRTPEVKSVISELDKKIKEVELKAYIDPEKAEEAKTKGNDFFNKGNYAEAVKHYSEAIKRNPDDPKLYSNRAACYTKLAAFDLGLKDCEKCVELDSKFIKGWIRKGKILQGMQQHAKALPAYQKALDLDPSNAEAIEGYRSCSIAVNSDPEEVRKRAMADPEIQAILNDPAMRLILSQMQTDPKALNEHLKNPDVASKVHKLMEAGLIAIR